MVVDVVSSSGTSVDGDVDVVVEPVPAEVPEASEPLKPEYGAVTRVVVEVLVGTALVTAVVTGVAPVEETASVCATGAGGSALVPFLYGDT
jgi:hypothetical protein